MAAYIMVFVKVTDPEQYAKYRERTPGVIAKFGGRFAIRGGNVEALEGAYDGRRVVLIEFASMADAHRFWDSEEYAELKALRAGAAEMQAWLVPGMDAAR